MTFEMKQNYNLIYIYTKIIFSQIFIDKGSYIILMYKA